MLYIGFYKEEIVTKKSNMFKSLFRVTVLRKLQQTLASHGNSKTSMPSVATRGARRLQQMEYSRRRLPQSPSKARKEVCDHNYFFEFIN